MVLEITNASAGITAMPSHTSGFERNANALPDDAPPNPATRGELELDWNASCRKNRVIPTANRLIATPTTIWSALKRMLQSACTPPRRSPAATPVTRPTHALPV